MIESGKVFSSHSSRCGCTSFSRKRRMCRRSSSCASVKYIRRLIMAAPGRSPRARLAERVRYDRDGPWAEFPAVWICVPWSWFGFGNQEAAQEDAQAQAQEDAQEDP